MDHYMWAKQHIRQLYQEIQPIKSDSLKTSPGNIWSVKKLLFLDYYIGSFVKIIRSPKYNFKSWYYVDPFCGSGLIAFEKELKNERFPGSPMIAALRAGQYPFSDYLFSDVDAEPINALRNRLLTNRTNAGNRDYSPKVTDFASIVAQIQKMQQWGTAFLIFIDPTGYKETKWELMEKLFEIETADIVFTFMTYRIALNRSKADSNDETACSLTEFFGDNRWLNCQTGDELLNEYRKLIHGKGKKTAVIPVNVKGESKLYDIIFSTRSIGGSNVVASASKIMDAVSTELIRSSFQVVAHKRTEISDYF
jgi:three-Cys-motif partner protein